VTEGKTNCTDCHAEILVSTGVRLGGLCARCAKLSVEERRAHRDFDERRRSGALFTPSARELGSARPADYLLNPRRTWRVDVAESDRGANSLGSALLHATQAAAGDLFLLSDRGERLNVAYKGDLAVLQFHLEDGNEELYVHTDRNIRTQVDRDLQLEQCCPCCGVGLFWYPSRFHMPRLVAFSIVRDVVVEDDAARLTYSWLEYDDDISHVSPGRG